MRFSKEAIWRSCGKLSPWKYPEQTFDDAARFTTMIAYQNLQEHLDADENYHGQNVYVEPVQFIYREGGQVCVEFFIGIPEDTEAS